MRIIHLFCLLSFILSSVCWAENSKKTSKEQAAKPKVKAERPTIIGIIKSRTKKNDDYNYYYIELDDGQKIHISKEIENVNLKQYLNKRVEIKTRLRVKTKDKTNDFIKQIYEIKKLKKEEF